MKLRKLLVVLFVLVCVVSLACFTACKDGGDVNDDGAGDQITDGGNTDNGNNNGDVGDNTGNDNTGDNNQTPDVGGDNNETPDVGGDNTGDNNETPDIGGDDNGDNGENPDIGGDDNGEEPETPAVVLDSISAVYNGSDITVNGILDSTLIFVTAYYTNETNSAVATFVVGDFDSSVAGVKEVTISYTEGEITKTTTINVTVVEEELEEPEIVLDSISAVYGGEDIIVGGTLDSALISVIATYSDTSTAPVTDFSVTGFDSATAGEKEVTVSYTEGDVTKTDIISVTVVEEELEEPEVLEEGIYYYNANGWENVYTYAWNTEFAPTAPTAEDFVIKGVDGDWATGLKMDKMQDVETGWRYVKLTVNGTDGIKVNKGGVWSGNVVNSDGVSYTHDGDGNVVLAAGTYTIDYYTDTNNMIIKVYEESDGAQTGTVSTTITEVWPGDQMTAVEGHDGWFYIGTIEADYVIFNNGLAGEEAAQTANIAMDSENTFYNGTEWVNGIN